MKAKNNQSNSKITRRTALSVIGTVGSLGLAGCVQSLIGEASSVTVVNNNTSNTVYVEVISDSGTIIKNRTYDMEPDSSKSFEYAGNASKISVTVNGDKTKTVPFVSPTFTCPPDKVGYNVVGISKNGSIEISTSCIKEA